MITRANLGTILLVLLLLAVLLAAGLYTYRTTTKYQVESSDAGLAFFGDQLADEPVGESSDLPAYTTTLGTTVDMHDYFGKIIYVNSWASWSPLSRDELIALNEVAANYTNQDVVFIALNRKEGKEQAERLLGTLPPINNLQLVIDTSDQFYRAVSGYAMPETLIYDKKGNLISHDRVPLSSDQMKERIDQALATE